MKKVYLFILLCVCSVFFPVHMISPADTDVTQGNEIFLGKMGPGQTIYIEMDPWVYSGDEYKGHYDLMLAYDLPEGWKSTESKLYEDPMQITITSLSRPTGRKDTLSTITVVAASRNYIRNLHCL